MSGMKTELYVWYWLYGDVVCVCVAIGSPAGVCVDVLQSFGPVQALPF